MSYRNETDEYPLKVVGQTDAAWKVEEDPDDPEDLWLPKGSVEVSPSNPKIDTVATFTIPNWLAEAKGLI